MRYILTKGLENIPAAADIRVRVFNEEQGFQNEFDDIDAEAFHVVVFAGNTAAATGRLFFSGNGCMHIGRVAVIKEHRKKSLGAFVIAVLEKKARGLGCKRIELSSQVRARGFYEKLGYTPEGGEYLDEDCPHIKMIKNLF